MGPNSSGLLADVARYRAYLATAYTGAMAAGLAEGSAILSFRWTSTTEVALIDHVDFNMWSTGTGFTAGVVEAVFDRVTGFTAADSGGTSVKPGAGAKMLRSSYAASAVNDLRVSSTAALTDGTRTIDYNCSIRSATIGTGTWTTPFSRPAVLFSSKWFGDRDHPLILGANEGFIVRAGVPATGTWSARMNIAWREGPSP